MIWAVIFLYLMGAFLYLCWTHECPTADQGWPKYVCAAIWPTLTMATIVLNLWNWICPKKWY